MSEETKQTADTSSLPFEDGEARLNSTGDANNRQAGNELGRVLKDEGLNKKRASGSLLKQSPSTPLFIRNSPGGNKGNAQDEKDETEE